MAGLRRYARFVFLAAGLLLALLLARAWPKEQTVHYILGEAAPRVEEVDARWAPGASSSPEEWAREASFRYAPGQAPRVVTHQPRLPDGDYTVEIEILADNQTSVVRRHVQLAGGSTSIELAPSVPR